MRHGFESKHEVNEQGFPAGGVSTGCGIEIHWQNGPLREEATPSDGACGDPILGPRKLPNGAFVEDLIAVVIDRIRFYQQAAGGRFQCRQNALAVTKLEEALHWLDDRTAERERRGVEGTHKE